MTNPGILWYNLREGKVLIMAYRDKAKKDAYDEDWKKANTTMCGVRFMNSSGIPAAMEKAITAGNTTKNGYIVAAVREKLIRDGYLSEKTEE